MEEEQYHIILHAYEDYLEKQHKTLTRALEKKGLSNKVSVFCKPFFLDPIDRDARTRVGVKDPSGKTMIRDMVDHRRYKKYLNELANSIHAHDSTQREYSAS